MGTAGASGTMGGSGRRGSNRRQWGAGEAGEEGEAGEGHGAESENIDFSLDIKLKSRLETLKYS